MFTTWKCVHCGLSNYDTRNHCQACFNKPTNLSPIQLISHQQNVAFHGYIRMQILNHLLNQTTPIDVINLCYKFYNINISSLIPPKPRSKDIRSIAVKCCNNRELYMAHRLLSIIPENKYRIVDLKFFKANILH